MRKHRRTIGAVIAAVAGIAIVASVALADNGGHRGLNGTVWVANRGANTIRGFDADTGDVVATVAMAPSSQPGDLAYAKGKLYVSEEFGTPPAIAIVDADTGEVLKRIYTGPRPHHVHASVGGNLIAYGVFGTNKVGIIDTHDDSLLGEWTASTNPAARSHAGVFSHDGHVVYVANDIVDELSAVDPLTGELLWSMTVPNAHELAVTHDGKTAYVTCRAGNALRVVDLERHVITATIPLGPSPDTLQLSANEKLLDGRPARHSRAGGDHRHRELRDEDRHDRRGGDDRGSPVDVSERALHVRGLRRAGCRACGHRSPAGRRDRPDACVSRPAPRRRLRETLEDNGKPARASSTCSTVSDALAASDTGPGSGGAAVADDRCESGREHRALDVGLRDSSGLQLGARRVNDRANHRDQPDRGDIAPEDAFRLASFDQRDELRCHREVSAVELFRRESADVDSKDAVELAELLPGRT